MCDHADDIKEIKESLQQSAIHRSETRVLLESLAQRFDEHVQKEEHLHQEHTTTLYDLKNQIGDNHKGEHEFIRHRIEKDKKRAELYDSTKKSVAQWGALALIGFVAKAVWDYIVHHGGH